MTLKWHKCCNSSVEIYVRDDGKLCYKDETGTEIEISTKKPKNPKKSKK